MGNDHYVTRALTKPWEHADRRLHFYDFQQDKFGTASSRNLFARRDLNDEETEQRLGKLIESPLTNALAHYERGGTLNFDARMMRAVSLLYLAQSYRRQHATELAELLRKPENELDQLRAALLDQQKIVVVHNKQMHMLYPETGMFVMTATEKPPASASAMHPFSLVWVIPLSPTAALILGTDTVDFNLLARSPGLFDRASVGLHGDRVALSEVVVKSNSPPELRARLLEVRQQTRELVALYKQADELMARMAAIAGLQLHPRSQFNITGQKILL